MLIGLNIIAIVLTLIFALKAIYLCLKEHECDDDYKCINNEEQMDDSDEILNENRNARKKDVIAVMDGDEWRESATVHQSQQEAY